MKHIISKVWIESGHIYAQTRDGLTASYPVAMWKRLATASEEQLNDFYLSYSGIHWPLLDEDLSFEGMFHSAGLCERTASEDPFAISHKQIVRNNPDYVEDGACRVFDFSPVIAKYPVFKELSDIPKFRNYVLTDTLEWNDGEIDIAPEYLYENGVVATW